MKKALVALAFSAVAIVPAFAKDAAEAQPAKKEATVKADEQKAVSTKPESKVTLIAGQTGTCPCPSPKSEEQKPVSTKPESKVTLIAGQTGTCPCPSPKSEEQKPVSTKPEGKVTLIAGQTGTSPKSEEKKDEKAKAPVTQQQAPAPKVALA
jgi:hypothetical protein